MQIQENCGLCLLNQVNKKGKPRRRHIWVFYIRIQEIIVVFDLFVTTVDGSENPANQLVGSISHYLHWLFLHA